MNILNNNWVGKKLQILLLLMMLYITINLVGTALVYKLVLIGPILGPGGLVVLPLVFLIEDVVAELFGYKIARFLLWLIILSTLLFCLLCVGIVHLPSPSDWHNQSAYDTVFGPILRTGPSALVAISVGRFVNIYLITKWKIWLNGRFFWARCVMSTIFGSILALTIFFFLAFWGSLSWSVIEKLFLCDFFVRVMYAVIGGIPANIIVNYLKNTLDINVYDHATDFNPFRLAIEN